MNVSQYTTSIQFKIKWSMMLRRKSMKTVFLESQQEKTQSHSISLIKGRCKGCELCTEFCPREILELSHEYNEKGYHYPKLKLGKTFADCSGCNFCEIVCPEFAIIVKELES